MILSVGSFNFNAEKMFRCATVTFTFELPLLGRICRVTRVVMRVLTMTVVVAIWIVLCILFSVVLAFQVFLRLIRQCSCDCSWNFVCAVELSFCKKLLTFLAALLLATLVGFIFDGGGPFSSSGLKSVGSGEGLVKHDVSRTYSSETVVEMSLPI